MSVEFKVFCNCGADLDAEFVGNRYGADMRVEVCEKCLEAAKEEGHAEGKAEAEKEKEMDDARDES